MTHTHTVGSNAFIINTKGKFLVVKRADNDEYFSGSWELPGGGVDENETPQESLKREVLEECGLKVEVGKPLGVHNFSINENGKEVQVIEITFLCRLEDSEQQVALSHEHSDFQWISQSEIERLSLSSYMLGVVTDALDNL